MTASTAAVPFISFQPVAPARRQVEAELPVDPLAQLVEAAKEGDRFATEQLIGHLRPLIVRYCRARIGKAVCTFSSADDVAQDVCMAVLTSLPSYRSTGRSFLSFVYGIATHKIMDFHRKRTRDRSVVMSELPDAAEPSDGPEQRLLRQELGERLGELLTELSEVQFEVLTLRLVVGLSVAETAEAVSASQGAVRVCQHRALAKLRRHLEASRVPATL